MQISIKGYITSKESELFYDCADRYAYNKFQNKFAISDGVSKSFFPKIWADVLVNKWVSQEWSTDIEFIEYCQKDWLKQVTEIVNEPDVKWFTKNAFNRKESGLATFIGLRFLKKKKDWYWKANALGDSFLFFVPTKFKDFSKECIVLSSKQKPIVFDNFPDYLSSLGNKHKGKKQPIEKLLTTGTFYLMTDALAEWFLNEKENAINKINVWQNQKDFERFVNEERLNEKLGNDDSAILTIQVEEDKRPGLDYIFEDVSDINELIEAQQKEIKASKKDKEEKLILQTEKSNNKSATEITQLVEPEENKLSEELETEMEKPKQGLLKRIFAKEEKEVSEEKEEIKTEEKTAALDEQQEENESSIKEGENDIEIQKSVDTGKNEGQESKRISKKESEVKDKKPKNSPKNAIDKF